MTDSNFWNADNWYQLMESAPLTFERAGCRQIPPPSMVVSAGSLVRRPVVGSNWIATGDAAPAFDPLSGQGVLKSIETGTRCAAAIARYFAGDSSALAAYESWVQETYQAYCPSAASFTPAYCTDPVRNSGSGDSHLMNKSTPVPLTRGANG